MKGSNSKAFTGLSYEFLAFTFTADIANNAASIKLLIFIIIVEFLCVLLAAKLVFNI